MGRIIRSFIIIKKCKKYLKFKRTSFYNHLATYSYHDNISLQMDNENPIFNFIQSQISDL